jgi:DNA-nicking Smr family endonuclease
VNRPIHRSKGLTELEALRTRLQGARAQAEAEAQRAHALALAREAALRHERDFFVNAIGTVQPLRRTTVAVSTTVRPEPVARQLERDEAQVLEDSISDEFDVESLLETDDSLSFRRPGVGPEVVRKLRRGVWATQAKLDLHGLRRDEAREQLAGFLRAATQAGLRCVRVIHGKGNGSPGRQGVLKAKVKVWLVQRQEVIAFTQARPVDGGQGALMVLLGPVASMRVR